MCILDMLSSYEFFCCCLFVCVLVFVVGLVGFWCIDGFLSFFFYLFVN